MFYILQVCRRSTINIHDSDIKKLFLRHILHPHEGVSHMGIEDGGREHYLLRYLEYLKLYFTKTDKAYRTVSLEPPFPFISAYN